MNECDHKKRLAASEHSKKIGGREFRYLAQSCASCGAVLWSNAAEEQLRNWLRVNKDKFVLQFAVPRAVEAGLQQLLQRYPGTAESHFVRAVLAVFTSVVFASKELSEQVSSVRTTEAYKILVADGGERVKMKARINPSLLEVVEAWAALVGMSVPKFVEECLTQMVALFGTRGRPSVWSEELDRQLDLVMKAA